MHRRALPGDLDTSTGPSVGWPRCANINTDSAHLTDDDIESSSSSSSGNSSGFVYRWELDLVKDRFVASLITGQVFRGNLLCPWSERNQPMLIREMYKSLWRNAIGEMEPSWATTVEPSPDNCDLKELMDESRRRPKQEILQIVKEFYSFDTCGSKKKLADDLLNYFAFIASDWKQPSERQFLSPLIPKCVHQILYGGNSCCPFALNDLEYMTVYSATLICYAAIMIRRAIQDCGQGIVSYACNSFSSIPEDDPAAFRTLLWQWTRQSKLRREAISEHIRNETLKLKDSAPLPIAQNNHENDIDDMASDIPLWLTPSIEKDPVYEPHDLREKLEPRASTPLQ